MKKKFIFFTMMLLTILGGVKFNVLNAQETIIVGNGNTTINEVPTYITYNYSLSQQIYTAAELGFGKGLISGITFYASGGSYTRTIDVYMINTSKEVFSCGNSCNDWVSVSESDKVYSGSHTFTGESTIVFSNPFEYTGENILICVDDNTGTWINGPSFKADNTGYQVYRTLRIYGDNENFDPKNTSSTAGYYGTGVNYHNQIGFRWENAVSSITVSETEIALGNVRMDDNFFTEKLFASKDVEVKVTSTTVTRVTCDNNFFTITNVPEDLSKTFTFKVGYNKEATDYENEETGIITIKWADGDDITIPVSATPYTAVAPDAIEAFTTVTFDADGAFTDAPTFGNLHDDYILPGEDEETNGNTPDAVYQFTLKNDAFVTANVTGDNVDNSYLAIYKAPFAENEGPSSNNNYTGITSGPEGPTTFSFDFDDGDLSNFTIVDNNHNGQTWDIANATADGSFAGKCIIDYSYKPGIGKFWADDFIYTNDKYSITEQSVVSFDVQCTYNGEHYALVVFIDDDNYEIVQGSEETVPTSGTTYHRSYSLSKYAGQDVKIGFYHFDSYDAYAILFDNFTLTDGSSKSRGVAPGIEAQFEAGTYYLVAAADNAFTVSLSAGSVPAPEAFALTAPENGATGQENPELTWKAAQYATEYEVYLSTSNDFTNVEPIVVTTNSYKPELAHNTKYYWKVIAKNSTGEQSSEVRSFVTVLDVPQNVTVTSENHIAGGDINITWDAVEGATSYNVFVKVNGEDICHNGATPITEITYTINNIGYNMEGWNITVTAVYEGLGESEKSEAVNVKVTDYGKILVNVNGGIPYVKYTINGKDEFGNAVEKITDTTDEYGMATVDVKFGTYTVTVSKFDYKDKTVNTTVAKKEPTEVTIDMTQNPEATFTVTAVDNATTANVSWTTDEYATFNVYRRDSEGNVTKLASDTTAKQYADEAWNEFKVGSQYEYGVSTYVPDEAKTLMNEGFESGNFTVGGWTLYTDNYYGYNWTVNTNSYNGVYCARVYNSEANNIFTLTSSEIDLSSYDSASLSFYYINKPYGSYGYNDCNTFKVKVKAVGDAGWNVTTMDQNILSYTLKELDLSKYIGKKIQIAFECNTAQWAYTYLDNVVVTAVPMTESRINWAPAITKEEWVAFNGTENNTWSNKNVLVDADHTINGEVTVKNMIINDGKLTVAEGAKLTVNGRTVNATATAGKFIIADGAQVIQKSADVKATFNMGVIKPEEWSSNNKDGWNFIASPFTNAGLSQFTFDMSGKGLDLYRYNGAEDKEWRHYNVGNTEFASNIFDNGEGYMLAHETKETVSLFGSLNPAQTYTRKLTYSDSKDLANFHLIGNPFSFNMDMSAVEVNRMVEGYVVLNENGDGYVYQTSGIIPVGDAFFVKTRAAQGDEYGDPTFTYSTTAKRSTRKSSNSINVIATGNAGTDNVVINLAGKSEGFDKLQNFNDEIATVYVAENGKRYGIANVDENTTEVALNFDANKMGNYTISIEPNGKFETVTLVDRFTGIETNMLLEDYNFTATSNDNANRFIVKLEVSGQEPTANGNFAYVSGEDLIIEAEGTVQIIDVMGRIIYSDDVESTNNRINVSNFDNAAYVIRVINENGVKVQKIIL